MRKSFLVETTQLEEDVATDSSEPGPKGRGDPGVLLMDVMMKQVSEVGDDATFTRIVVVGAENGRKAGIAIEGAPDPGESVLVDLDVGIDEDENVALGSPRAEIPRARRTESGGLVDDDQLLGGGLCALNGSDSALQSRWSIRSRDDDRQGPHRLSLGLGPKHAVSEDFRA